MTESNPSRAGKIADGLEGRHGRSTSGWGSWLARLSMAVLLFETLTGLAIPLWPFHPAVQYGVIAHTALGALGLLPVAWYVGRHWWDYRHWPRSQMTVLGYVAMAGLAVCALSGLVVMGEALWGVRTSRFWRQTHLLSTLVMLVGLVPHLGLIWIRALRTEFAPAARGYLVHTAWMTAVATAGVALLPMFYAGTRYENRFPDD